MLLKKLSELNGVSGNENAVRDFIINELKGHVDELKVDNIGNVIVHKKGFKSESKIAISTHMDEVGLIINKIDSKGFLKFTLVGDIDERILVSKPVLVGKNKIQGVIGSKPIHLQERDERKNALKYNQLYIDIGCNSKEEAEKLVHIGEYVSFDSDFLEFGENMIKGKALDNRASCSVLIDLLKSNNVPSFYGVFSVMKEIGINGGLAASYEIDPDINIILDSSFKEDALGKGPLISFMENRTALNRPLTKDIIDLAKENNIKYQLVGFDTSKSDANSIQTSGKGSKTIKISIPHKYSYSPVNVMNKEDINNTSELMTKILSNLGGKINENK